jgi:hypothetical protein
VLPRERVAVRRGARESVSSAWAGCRGRSSGGGCVAGEGRLDLRRLLDGGVVGEGGEEELDDLARRGMHRDRETVRLVEHLELNEPRLEDVAQHLAGAARHECDWSPNGRRRRTCHHASHD